MYGIDCVDLPSSTQGTTVSRLALLVTLTILLGSALAFADGPSWDEFGVAMSQDEHARNSGNTQFGGGSLRLTPLPVFVRGVAESQLPLDGTWYFRSSPPDNFQSLSEPDVESWDRVEVPGDYRMQGYGGGTVAYMRFFALPADWSGGRVKIRCEEIATEATVWVNGKRIGGHIGHFIAFEFDITEAVRFGERNSLAIRVKYDSIARRVSGYALHVAGGITRSVRLFAVPGTNLARLHTTTDLDDEYTDATLNLQLSIANETTKSSDAISVTVELLDPKGQRVEFESNEIALPSVPAGELQSHEVSIPVCSPKKWNAEHPSLYRLHITLLEGNRPRETVQRRIGFRGD